MEREDGTKSVARKGSIDPIQSQTSTNLRTKQRQTDILEEINHQEEIDSENPLITPDTSEVEANITETNLLKEESPP